MGADEKLQTNDPIDNARSAIIRVIRGAFDESFHTAELIFNLNSNY
jgi:hypothetical protein